MYMNKKQYMYIYLGTRMITIRKTMENPVKKVAKLPLLNWERSAPGYLQKIFNTGNSTSTKPQAGTASVKVKPCALSRDVLPAIFLQDMLIQLDKINIIWPMKARSPRHK